MTTQEILVVKIGGAEGIDHAACAADLAAIADRRPLVVVHGVSAAVNALCAERGVPVRMLTSPTGHSSRYTDPQTRDLYVEAAESVNHALTGHLTALGIAAEGLTGANIPLLGERKSAIRALVDGRVRIIRDDYSGSITGVDVVRVLRALTRGSVAVVPPLAASADGLLNVDGDRAGAAVAAALGASDYVILSGVRGLYRRFPDESSFVPRVNRDELDSALDWAQGRMKRKVIGASEALSNGVQRVIIADGRVHMPVRAALGGHGTDFLR